MRAVRSCDAQQKVDFRGQATSNSAPFRLLLTCDRQVGIDWVRPHAVATIGEHRPPHLASTVFKSSQRRRQEVTSSNRRPSGAARRRSQPALSHASHATPDQRDDQHTHLRATCACSYRKTAWALGRIRSDKHCGRHAIPSPWQEQGSALPAVSRRSEELEVRLPTAAPEMRLLLSNLSFY